MTVAEAITALRKNTSMTQQQMAYRIASAVSAMPKYEAGRVPDPAALMRLVHLAEETGHPELAQIFREQMYRDLKVPDSWEGVAAFEPRDDFEKMAVAALLATLRSDCLRDKRPAVLTSLFDAFQMIGNKIRKQQVRLRWLKILKEAQKHAGTTAGIVTFQSRFTTSGEFPAAWDLPPRTDQPNSSKETVSAASE